MNPYSVPATPGAPPPSSFVGPPAAWGWYVVYAVLMALTYLALSGVGLSLLLAGGVLGVKVHDEESTLTGVAMLGLGFPLFIAFAAAPFLPRAPWVWVFHLVLICLGLTSACCMPLSLPLLIYWLKPETKAFFGRTV